MAKYNAEGVTHADMEKTGREAYEIMSHRCRYSKTSQGGVRYISFNDKSVPASTHAPHCSEGDGYMLLMSAIFADQPTFNGLWMWIHDYKIPKVERYYDGQVFLPNYKFSPGLPLCYTDETNIDAEEGSATDGDDDIALAVLIAYKQWGEWMMQDGKQVLDSKGRPISYKKIAQDFLAAYVDTFMITSVNGDGSIYKGGHTSGDIGIDGYVHGGNKGGDMTQWRQTQTDYPFVTPNCNLSTPDAYADYVAPAYYNEFAKFLEEDGNGTDWQINQYKRGEASSDWLIGQAYKQGMIASAGKFSFAYGNDANVSFTQFSEGEDFRFVLRTILNYMWHGNPETTWDPVAHQPKAGGNTFEKDMADRMADFLKKPWSGYGNKAPGDSHGQCVQMGSSPDPGQPYWSGVCNIMQSYNGDKTPMGSGASPAPYTLGASAAAAVCSGDLDLIADMYRQSEITWDGTNKAVTWDSEERYIGNTPEYFHGFYRCWGLLTHTGNLHAPQDMKREANVKVYMSVDKTYAYVDDEIEYHVQFRNYGSAEATGVKIETELDPNYEVVAIKRGNGTVSGNKIIWNVGSIPGFKTGGLAATMDSVSFVVVVKDTLNPRICLTSTISGSNFEDWTSNEYPNHATYTMERNCVDIVPDRTLQLKKKASRKLLNPNDAVTFTLEFENKSLGEASWLNGGRDNVRLSYANYISGTEMFQGYRFWHDAYEAYINPGNYRVSYFMYDAAAMGLYSNQNPTGWDFTLNNYNDCYKYLLTETPDTISFHYQRIPSGEDEHGKWNQRLMVQFADYTMAPSSYTFNKIADRQGTGANNFYSLHKGVSGPSFIRTQLRSNPHLAMDGKVKDDWSYKKLQTKDRPMDMQTSALYLLTPCYADVNNLGYPVDIHARNVCYTGDIDMTTYDRMLVEEFDGYTWRRILGRAPLPGRECMNVQVVDTIPYELEFHHWVDSTALKNDKGEKIKATYTPAPAGTKAYSGIIKWSVPSMLVGEKDKLIYVCVARNMGCPDVDDVYYSNVAWISSETDSPDSSRVDLVTTCREIPPVGDEQESLFKSADKKAAQQGETVTYEVKYINNTGTHVEANCKSTDGWKALGGSSLPKVDGGHLLLNTEGSYLFAPEYSYGNNGDVYLQLDNCTDAITNTWVVLRWTAGTPGSSNFKGAAVKLTPHASLDNTFKCEVYDNGTCIAKEGEGDDLIIYPGNARNPEFKFTFVDDHLFMYINNADEEWVDVMKDWKGMSAKGPGYFGMFVNGKTNSGPHLTKFETDLDYAFNVTLYDQLPEELGNITSISDNGSWNEPKNFITWPTVATTVETAIPPMDSVVRTYTAEVKACVDRYITNMGIGTVYGLDTLKVLNTIQCGVEECELAKADVQFVDDVNKICEGDSVLLVGYGDDGKDGSRFLYEFFLNDVSLGKASYTWKIFVNKAGVYHVKVSSPADPTCFLESKKVVLTVNERPVGQDFPLGTLCVGTDPSDNAKYAEMMTTIDGRPAGVNYNWVGDNGGVPIVFPSVSTDAVGDFDKPYFLNTEDGCVSDTFHLTYTVADTAVVKLSDLTICSGQSGTLTAGTDMTYTYLWSDGSTLNELVTDQPGKYSVVVTTPDGCESKASATITVADELKVDLGADTTICDVNLPLVLDASSSYDTYEWTDGSTLSTLSVTESGEYEVKVTQGSCSGSGKISVTVSPTPELKGTFKVTYLVNDTTAAGVFDKSLTAYDATVLEKESGIDYTWYDENQNELSSEPIPDVPVGGGNGTATYYVKAKNAEGCESQLQKVTVQISGSPMPTATDVAYCLNATDVKPLEATPGDNGSATNWTLRWYDAAGNQLNDAPVPDVTVAGETNYYVSQVDEQGTEGGKAVVTVSVYDLPQIKAEPQSIKLCNTPYALNAAFREANGLSVTYSYYDANKDLLPDPDPMAEKSGVYYAKASYAPVTDLLCESADYASVDVVIDKITDIKVVASPSICPLGETELVASATSEGSALSFSWSGDATGNDASLKMKDETGEYGKVYSYKLQMTAGLCVFDTTLTVTVGRGVLTGAITANGVATKEYRTCGDEDIELSATHEGSDFKWTTYDGNLLASEISTTVHPTQTTTYILTFVNECETSDTVVVEIYPFSLSTQFSSLDTAVCEGASAMGHLSLNGYSENMSGSYIKWFREGVELPEYEGLSTLEIPNVTAQDGGEYTFEASNGICLAKSLDGVTSARLTVKPFVSFATPSEVVTANGASASLELNDLVPSDATVVWKGSVNEGVGNPFQIDQVFADELFDVSVTAEGYCERDAQLQLVVDAKVIVSASTTTPKICLNDAASLVADTVGTGHLMHPEKYSVVWYACDESGNCESLQIKGLDLTHYPESNISYYAVVTYGEQVAYSDTIPVTVLPQVSYTTSSDVVSCSGEEVTLSVEIEDAPDALVTWADGSEGNTLSVNPTEATKYGFTITQDGLCPQTDSIPVAVRENPSIKMEDDIVVCSGNGIAFDPTVSGDDIDTYHWINPDGDTIAHTQKLTIKTEPVSGTYTFVAVSQFCGEAVGTQKVDIAALPELLIDSLSINSRKLVPVGRAGQFEFKVDNNDWSTQDVYENLTYDYPHTAFVRDELGCEGMTIFVVTAPPIAIPDYFTPSEDGLNDTWDLSTIMDAYPNTKVTIYDRTGKVVAVLEGDVTDWDGTYNGYPLPSTDYWYLINVPEIRRQFTGHFTLIRTK
ncbi:MAG: T9SS type B sorting domain-containing protein [Paludibacteraceae bacterium]|nr:T9SS type B sorting domain-containing protein [Paludibacteraceae bacterium]